MVRTFPSVRVSNGWYARQHRLGFIFIVKNSSDCLSLRHAQLIPNPHLIDANSVILVAHFLGVRCFRSLDRCLIAEETTGDCETWVCI